MNLAPSIPTPLRSAFTLLELLLAVTVLASVTGLVAVTYSQMNGWVADNGTEQRMMRLHRVLKLMTDQWEDRRTAAWAEGEHRILTGDTGIGFLTATPILFPDWPLVRVAYRIVPTPDRAPGAPETWDLLYEEVRVVELGAPPEDEQQKTTDNARPRTPPVDLEAAWDEFDALPETDAWGNPLRRELTLLTHCTELRIERYGLAADILQEAGLAAPVSQPSRTPGTTGGERTPGAPRDGQAGESRTEEQQPLDPMSSGALEAARAAGVSDEIIRQAAEMRWRPHGHYSGFVPAVRMVGSSEEREFSCVFALRALH